MPIKYAIRENPLTTPTTFRAGIREITTFSKANLVRDILSAGSTVTEADINAVMTDLIKIIGNRLLDGGRVDLEGIVQIFPSIEGVFTGAADDFDPGRHRLNLNAKVSETLKTFVRQNATLEKELTPPAGPTILEVLDAFSGTSNTTLTVNKIINMLGDNLKFDSSRADEGVFFINDTTPAEVQVAAGDISIATDGKIVFMTAGSGVSGDSCHMEVRTRMGNSVTYPLKTAVSAPLTMG